MKSLKLFSILLFTCISTRATNVEQDSGIIKIKKTSDFELTGKADAKNWEQTSFIEIPYREGNKHYSTKFKILYSERGIYCLYISEDSIITSTIKEDFADIYNEDVVEAFFWPDETSNIYFEYELSPHNFELPILVPNYNGKFLGWRPWHYEGDRLTRHAASINKPNGKTRSWIAEFFIPYKLLAPLQNVPPHSGTKWRGNFYRIDYDDQSTYWTWVPIRTNFHDYEKFGTIVFE